MGEISVAAKEVAGHVAKDAGKLVGTTASSVAVDGARGGTVVGVIGVIGAANVRPLRRW